MTITCPHCGREDVEKAVEIGYSWDRLGYEIDLGNNHKSILSMDSPICIDCLTVASHFLKKGLRAFRESLASSKQLDLFPAEKLTSESGFADES